MKKGCAVLLLVLSAVFFVACPETKVSAIYDGNNSVAKSEAETDSEPIVPEDGEVSVDWVRPVATIQGIDRHAGCFMQSLDSYVDGSSVVTGWYRKADIQIGSDAAPFTCDDVTGQFLARLDAEGNPAWARCIPDIPGKDPDVNARALPDGGVLLFGMSFLDAEELVGATDTEDGSVVEALLHRFIAKLDADGNLSWRIKLSGSAETFSAQRLSRALYVDVQTDGTVAVMTTFPGRPVLTQDGTDAISIGDETDSPTNAFILLSQDGVVMDARLLDAEGGATAAARSDDGTIVFARAEPFDEPRDEESIESEYKLIAYDAEGNRMWSMLNTNSHIRSIDFLPNGSIVTTGDFLHTMSLHDDLGNSISLTGVPRYQEGGTYTDRVTYFIAGYSDQGELLFGKTTAPPNAFNRAEINHDSVHIDADGHIVVAGWSEGQVTFGPGEPGETTVGTENPIGFEYETYRYTPNTSQYAGRSRQLFLARYNPDGTLDSMMHTGAVRAEYLFAAPAPDDKYLMLLRVEESPSFLFGQNNEVIDLPTSAGGSLYLARSASSF